MTALGATGANAPKQGLIRQKDANFHTLRVKVTAGVLRSGQLSKLAQVAEEFGRGELYLTGRMNVEIPWIKEKDYDAIAARLSEVGVMPGSTGPSVRAIVACKGTTCRNGLIDTHALCRTLDKKFFGRKLPAKFKMRIAGCPNNCVDVKTYSFDENKVGLCVKNTLSRPHSTTLKISGADSARVIDGNNVFIWKEDEALPIITFNPKEEKQIELILKSKNKRF